MVRIVCITAALIFNESEPTLSVNNIRADFYLELNILTDEMLHCEGRECRNGQDDHSCKV